MVTAYKKRRSYIIVSMSEHPLHPHHPFRIFAFSVLVTIGALVGVALGLGVEAVIVAAILMVIEITFSFENAIVNAKVLSTMSIFWQKIFLTIGILIAIFGMRIIFPIAVVAISASLDWMTVIDLALNHPVEYAAKLAASHTKIAAFGGMFLAMLGLHFFFNDNKKVHWINAIEEPIEKHARTWIYIPVAVVILLVVVLLPANNHQMDTLLAGGVGIITYLVVHGLSELAGRSKAARSTALKTGMAGFIAFLYLEVLDASFSLDGVIGAFAITRDVVLIAVGLGVGAVWVRSLTVYMVRKKTLQEYIYLEHGAFYTVLALATFMLTSIFVHIPEFVAGSVGIVLISAAIATSLRAGKRKHVSI